MPLALACSMRSRSRSCRPGSRAATAAAAEGAAAPVTDGNPTAAAAPGPASCGAPACNPTASVAGGPALPPLPAERGPAEPAAVLRLGKCRSPLAGRGSSSTGDNAAAFAGGAAVPWPAAAGPASRKLVPPPAAVDGLASAAVLSLPAGLMLMHVAVAGRASSSSSRLLGNGARWVAVAGTGGRRSRLSRLVLPLCRSCCCGCFCTVEVGRPPASKVSRRLLGRAGAALPADPPPRAALAVPGAVAGRCNRRSSAERYAGSGPSVLPGGAGAVDLRRDTGPPAGRRAVLWAAAAVVGRDAVAGNTSARTVSSRCWPACVTAVAPGGVTASQSGRRGSGRAMACRGRRQAAA